MLKVGSVVDATLISVQVQRRTTPGRRDPDMPSTQKGSNWYFGARALDAAQRSALGESAAISVS
jgi:hypothetical protein